MYVEQSVGIVPGNATTMPRHPTQNKPTGFSCRYFVKRVEHSRTSTSITFQCIANRKTLSLSARYSFIVSRSGKSIILRAPWKMKKARSSRWWWFFPQFFFSSAAPVLCRRVVWLRLKIAKKIRIAFLALTMKKKIVGKRVIIAAPANDDGKEKKQRRREEWDAAKKQN